MLKRLCTAKIAHIFVTKAALQYEGSLGIDSTVMEAAGITPYEVILVANLVNASRFETYAIPEPAGSGHCCLYGAAAHLGAVGHELIVMTYGLCNEAETAAFKGPKVVRLAIKNKLR